MSPSPFRWANLPIDVLRAVLDRADVSSEDAAAELTTLYGAVPRGDFVADQWPALRTAWLAVADDPHTADAIVALRTAGLGDLGIDTTTPAGTASYLASCPASVRLRSVVLQAVLAAGGGSSGSGAAADAGGEPEPVVLDAAAFATTLIHPRNADELRAAVHATLEAMLGTGENGTGELVVDDDGDIPIRWGSALVYVRVLEDNPVIRIFSPIMRDVQVTDELRTAVNELNKSHLFVNAFWADGVVLLTADVPGAPFVPHHLVNLLNTIAETADSLDDQLHSRFANNGGGPDVAGYL